jgi:signal transduction histidine kinase
LKLAFTELERKNQELEDASLAKTQILTIATHELKTPLTSIVGYVDPMLLRRDTAGEFN